MYVCTYVLCNSAVFTKMPRLSDQGGGAILLKGASVHSSLINVLFHLCWMQQPGNGF